MPHVKGSRHSDAARAKMSAARKGVRFSAEHRAAISAKLTGIVREKVHERTCVCGVNFTAAVQNAKYCSRECKRAAKGHGLRHKPQFAHFPQACEICGDDCQLVGDHDHANGRPRGILCRRCNLAIGNMADSPARLRAAALYLERSRTRPAIYLCGPMTGIPQNNYPLFNSEARRIRLLGYHVENPAENLKPPCGTWQGWMRLSIAQLVTCDGIALLPGWEHSRGACVEYRCERDRANSRASYARNRLKRLAAKKSQFEAFKLACYSDAYRLGDRLRKARRRAAPHDGAPLTAGQWFAICKHFGNACAYCGSKPEVLEQDHVVAVSRGGAHTAGNVVPACKPCNSSKGDRLVEEFLARRAACG